MRRFIVSCTILCCTAFGYAQQDPSVQAWEIVFKMKMVPDQNASEETLKEVEHFNAQSDTLRIKEFISANGYNSTENAWLGENIIMNRKDSVVYLYASRDSIAYKMSVQEYVEHYKKDAESHVEVLHFNAYPDSTRHMLGFKVEKAAYTLGLDATDSLDTKMEGSAWYTLELPHWFNVGSVPDLPGQPLLITYENAADGLLVQYKAIGIHPISPDTLLTEPPDGYTVLSVADQKMKKGESHQPKAFKVDQKARDSISNLVAGQPITFNAASVFHNGLARVEHSGNTFYIDPRGNKVFDTLITQYQPVLKVTPTDQPGWVNIDKDEHTTVFIVEKDGRMGLINSVTGTWLLPPEYDEIKEVFKRYLKLTKEGKIGYADTWGKILLPTKFDDAGILDGHTYFDVKKGKQWGIYNAEQQEMALPFVYDEFDYCGGCGEAPSYVYASKNGKWGVVDFEHNTLLPFAYGHSGHWGIRGDNWVVSFEKDSTQVVINLATKKVYSKKEYQDLRVINGVLALKKVGKFALVNEEGRMLTDFVYDDVRDPYDHFHWGPFITVIKDGKYGIVDNAGKLWIRPDQYTRLSVQGDTYFVSHKEAKAGLLDSVGEPLLPNVYASVSDQFMKIKTGEEKGTQLFQVQKDSLYGWYNATTKTLHSPQFSRFSFLINPDSTKTYITGIRKIGADYYDVKKGLYALNGEEILPPQYEDIAFLSNDLLLLKQEDGYGLFDLKKRQQVLPSTYRYILKREDLSGFLELTPKEETAGDPLYRDCDQQEIVSLPFEKIYPSGLPNLWVVRERSETFLYALDQEQTISKGYPNKEYGSSIQGFKHGLAMVYQRDKYGYLNKKGKEIVPTYYDYATMSDGGVLELSVHKKEGLWETRYADSTGRWITAKPFVSQGGPTEDAFKNENFIFVKKYDAARYQDLVGVLTPSGHMLLPPVYEAVHPLIGDRGFIVQNGDFFGLLDREGNAIIPVFLDNVYLKETPNFYDSNGEWNADFPILCQLGDAYFYVNEEGEIQPFVARLQMEFEPLASFWQ